MGGREISPRRKEHSHHSKHKHSSKKRGERIHGSPHNSDSSRRRDRSRDRDRFHSRTHRDGDSSDPDYTKSSSRHHKSRCSPSKTHTSRDVRASRERSVSRKDRDSSRSRHDRRRSTSGSSCDGGTTSDTHSATHTDIAAAQQGGGGGGGVSLSADQLMVSIEEQRAARKQAKRQQKEAMKRLETPAQKRQRRLLKRAEKERIRKQKMGWDDEHLHYTNEDNPFGDANLLDTFRWDKKLCREGLQHLDEHQLEKISRRRMQENRRELEKVKARRLDREREMADREKELALVQGKLEAEQFRAWEEQEDQFHLKQCRMRSKIRIQEGRAKPIDLLAKYISCADEVDAVEVHEPYTYLLGLSATDLDDLLVDIDVYQRLEQGANRHYWADITVIVQDELQQLQRLQQQQQQQGDQHTVSAVTRRDGVNESVSTDVMSVFRGKSSEQLAALQTQVETKLRSGLDGVDVGYWESLLSSLKAHVARARLRDRHQMNLREKLRLLKASQGVTEASGATSVSQTSSGDGGEVNDLSVAEAGSSALTHASSISASKTSQDRAGNDDQHDEDDDEENMLETALREYSSGRYTPPLIMVEDLEAGQLVCDPGEDEQRLEHARKMVLDRAGDDDAGDRGEDDEDSELRQEARRGMQSDEAQFSVETDLGPQHHLWSDKYRPRKPRYFNRVHTGFEWNKYNQTHYDMDNPPPKVVQGYKFNIFYPDMIDKSVTPEYTLTPCEDNRDFCLLKFHTGPPYEDIAFKIVSREWEYSYRRGFRCQFYNNIFQLWFHFKRYRYRR